MAIAGGATSAYRCQVIDGELEVSNTTTLRSECVEVDAAVVRLGKGERVTVAGSDMEALRCRLGLRDSVGVVAV